MDEWNLEWPLSSWPVWGVASAPELNSSSLNEHVRLGGSCMTHPVLTQDSFL